jgi:hypothetical protein
MPFPVPEPWTRDSADVRRDESKRKESPCSFFFSQGQSLVLAADYFSDERLNENARGGVALKHRHRIHLSLFGQLMASFEYLLKDFVAKAIDLTAVLDSKVQKAKWVEVDAAKVLAYRLAATTPGAMLVHSTLGWHSPSTVNSRYQELFARQPISIAELPTLERLWVLRHSVAHNAGFVIHYDASRIGSANLAEHVANVDAAFMGETFNFLRPIADRIASEVGDAILLEWIRSIAPTGQDFARDSAAYIGLKKLATMVAARTRDVPAANELNYRADFARVM